MVPTIIILSFNSEDTIERTLLQAMLLSREVFVIDSGSTDGTVAITERLGVVVVHHAFENYGAQRNWAIENVKGTADWQLHLDADEQLSESLVAEIRALNEDGDLDGYLIPRYITFLGRLLKHNLAPTYHMRLFRNGRGACESRHYDQHFICFGPTGTLKNRMIDDMRMSLSEWTRRHNMWADAEVRELLSREQEGRVVAKFFGNAIQRKRALRKAYENLPLFVRPAILFVYRFVVRGGFLDGIEGFIFCVLQVFWFRFLVDAKLFEAKRARAQDLS